MQCKARASHSISFGGTCPDLFIAEDWDGYFTTETHLSRSRTSKESFTSDCKRKWILYLPKAYHPLLLQQHQQKLQKAKKDVSSAAAVSVISTNKVLGSFSSLLAFFCCSLEYISCSNINYIQICNSKCSSYTFMSLGN